MSHEIQFLVHHGDFIIMEVLAAAYALFGLEDPLKVLVPIDTRLSGVQPVRSVGPLGARPTVRGKESRGSVRDLWGI